MDEKIEKKKLRVFEAFAGIGAQASALKRMNINYEIVGIIIAQTEAECNKGPVLAVLTAVPGVALAADPEAASADTGLLPAAACTVLPLAAVCIIPLPEADFTAVAGITVPGTTAAGTAAALAECAVSFFCPSF